MPLLHVSASGRLPVAHGASEDLTARLERELDSLPPDAPVIILIHGYKYSPNSTRGNPHKTLLAMDPEAPGVGRVVSWPRHLGFGRGVPGEGLCISFGWHAQGWLRQVFNDAPNAGRALAHLVRLVHSISRRRVHILAHSMGARVALSALPHLPAGALGRAVLLSAAEFQTGAAEALACPAAAVAEFINVTSRENDLFDFLLECGVRMPGAKTLGQGLPEAGSNWVDIQLDDGPALDGLNALGFRIAPAQQIVCHWSTYMRPGAFGFYGAVMREADTMPLSDLRAALPGSSAPRWSRLRAQMQRPRALQPG
ncbi:MAG: alpha/beta hydrolase [Pseudomonadota bacterium]